jgi:peptide methionine sulfoxide reductase MsrB
VKTRSREEVDVGNCVSHLGVLDDRPTNQGMHRL